LNDISFIVRILAIALALLIAAAIGIIVWKTVTTKRFPLLIVFFIALPLGQLLILYNFKFETWTMYWIAGVLLGLCANISLLQHVISQEKRNAAEEELREVQHRIALEKSHYGVVQKRREQLAKMRLEFSDRLGSVVELASTGEYDSARVLISALSDQIAMTKENTYCANPVVNAIITEKDKLCEAADIGLTVDLDFPEPLAVSSMHLCSIFGNILDNAIAACQKTKSADRLIIRLSSKMNGDYLFIKATNPSDAPGFKPASGRGYGFRILSDLAERYGGGVQSNYRDGVFSVIVSLLAVEG